MWEHEICKQYIAVIIKESQQYIDHGVKVLLTATGPLPQRREFLFLIPVQSALIVLAEFPALESFIASSPDVHFLSFFNQLIPKIRMRYRDNGFTFLPGG